MNQKEVRWRQRYENFDRAYKQLHAALKEFDNLNVLEKEGLIQRFEYTFELAWKTVKDFLEGQGVSANFPGRLLSRLFTTGLSKMAKFGWICWRRGTC